MKEAKISSEPGALVIFLRGLGMVVSALGLSRAGKLLDVEFSIRGILRGFGLKMGTVTRRSFEARVRELCVGSRCWNRFSQRRWRRDRRCRQSIPSCTRQC
jgi:hypothetical protein